MSDNVLIAIISGSGTLLVALASLLLVYRGFNSIERRLEVIEGDIKQFFKDTARNEADNGAFRIRRG